MTEQTCNIVIAYLTGGNVMEWSYDWSGSVTTGTESDPTGASSGSLRVCRGGSWYGNANYASVSYRNGGNPDDRYSDSGFRVVRPATTESFIFYKKIFIPNGVVKKIFVGDFFCKSLKKGLFPPLIFTIK